MMEIGEQILLNELNKIRRSKLIKTIENARNAELSSEIEELSETQETTEVHAKDNEFQERDIIRLIINYGDREMEFEIEDENNEKRTITPCIAEWILAEISVDSIPFENKLYSNILHEVKKNLEEKKLADIAFFTQHSNTEIQQLAIEMISSKYELSEHWEKHNILVNKEEQMLKGAVDASLSALKNGHILKLIAENQEKLLSANEDNLHVLLEEQQKLQGAKIFFSNKMGRVILS